MTEGIEKRIANFSFLESIERDFSDTEKKQMMYGYFCVAQKMVFQDKGWRTPTCTLQYGACIYQHPTIRQGVIEGGEDKPLCRYGQLKTIVDEYLERKKAR